MSGMEMESVSCVSGDSSMTSSSTSCISTSNVDILWDLVISVSGDKYWIPNCDQSTEPFVGQVFDTLDQGTDFYIRYAAFAGFTLRNSTMHRSRIDNMVQTKYMVCNREGVKNSEKSKGLRKTTSDRCCCCAKIVFTKLKNHQYRVKDLELRHTHNVVSKFAQKFNKTNFELTEDHQRLLLDAKRARIGSVKAYKLCEAMMGGPDQVGANVTQFNNFTRDLLSTMEGSDAQMVIDRFTIKKNVCSAFYFNHEVDSSGRLTMLFWADPLSRRDYATFGENVAFDATYNTNRYKMIFAPFTGVDNNNNCVTFAAALMFKETIESYVWVFENFVKAMGKEPNILITDQDPSMKVAFHKVFTTTRHRFCLWHIMTKVPEKVGNVLSRCSEFRTKLDSIVWTDEIEPEEFELKWKLLIEEYKLNDNKWMHDMYELRRLWIPAYFRDMQLSGLMKTTSISESQNSFFKNYLHMHLTLVEFVLHFDSAIDSQRFTQKVLTAKQETKFPATVDEIQIHCSEVFTLYAFNEIQNDIKKGCRVLHFEESNDRCLFTKQNLDNHKGKTYKLEHNQCTGKTICSCSMFMMVGLPCRHVFLALKDLKVIRMPQNLILYRWMKSASFPTSFVLDGVIIEPCDQTDERKSMLNGIRSDFNAYMRMIENDKERISEFANVIKGYKLRGLTSMGANSSKKSNRSLMEELVGVSIPERVDVKDPEQAKNKGSGKRIKGVIENSREKNKKPKRICGECKQLANHDKRNCKKVQAGKRKRDADDDYDEVDEFQDVEGDL